ncbi:MAG: AI-2E family transporter, partial [Desulfosalsimonas sp.]
MLRMIREWFNQRFSDPQMVILLAILLGGFVGVILLGKMLQPVFVGLIIAYLLEGIVARLEKIRIPRGFAVGITFTVFMICLFTLVIGLLPLLSRQIGQLIQELPSLIANGQKQLLQLPERYPELISEEQIRQVIGFLKTELNHVGQNVVSISVASVKNLISLLIYLVLVPLLVLFFLKDKDRLLKWFKTLLPSNLELATEVWHEVNQEVGNFVRGKLWEIIIVWIASYITFSFLDLNYAMLVSLFIGLSVLIPYIGATVMTIP